MGVLKLFSSCSFDHQTEPKQPRRVKEKAGTITGNPNPSNFKILRHKEIGRFSVVMVKYPDCTNHEGKKVLVFENVSVEAIMNLNAIDPHFCDSSNHPSPIARFVPTSIGWNYAILFCQTAQ